MGSLLNKDKNKIKVHSITMETIPVRNFRNLHQGIDIENTRFAAHNPDRHRDKFKFPAKEPAKNY